jgi:Family of unknown function (DUF6152)
MKHSLLAFLMSVVTAVPVVYAHHSMAMFDNTKEVTLDGTVKSFRWTSPHSFIELTVLYKTGPVDWTIEMGGGGVNTLRRAGWTPETLKFGDKVTIVVHPLRNGRAGGNFRSLTFPDGKVMTLNAP